MNERIRELREQAMEWVPNMADPDTKIRLLNAEKFAQLIVEECRTVVVQVYRATPLEICGPLLTADEEIAKHFYGVEE
jgi:hypothetical protein